MKLVITESPLKEPGYISLAICSTPMYLVGNSAQANILERTRLERCLILKQTAKIADGECMNGMQIEHVLDLIDCNIDATMNDLHPEVLSYLKGNMDDLARQISENGYAEIRTRLGSVRIFKEDILTAA